jgi:hypothetical protein
MGMIDSNTLLPATVHRGIKPDTALAAGKSQTFCRPDSKGLIPYSSKRDGRSSPENSRCETQVALMDGTMFPRIRELEVELTYYRQRLEDLVQQRTEKLSRRISILEACNSNLCESYNQIRQMYLVLLASTQPCETGLEACGSPERFD